MTKRDDAVGVAQLVFAALAEQAGVEWTPNNDAAVADLVDAIIVAAREPQPTEHERAVRKAVDR